MSFSETPKPIMAVPPIIGAILTIAGAVKGTGPAVRALTGVAGFLTIWAAISPFVPKISIYRLIELMIYAKNQTGTQIRSNGDARNGGDIENQAPLVRERHTFPWNILRRNVEVATPIQTAVRVDSTSATNIERTPNQSHSLNATDHMRVNDSSRVQIPDSSQSISGSQNHYISQDQEAFQEAADVASQQSQLQQGHTTVNNSSVQGHVQTPGSIGSQRNDFRNASFRIRNYSSGMIMTGMNTVYK
ncbi:hypothetical protein WG66_008004 [Moniliophthora roreri]|uniref:Uncharacterized protein n=1 Tax=Moniliophthora roreri TaxID=221103 RepID=A0A0W0FXA8_MONRR|nr:hypothetical protein WG66_008004 [Moniliophthora roreri]